MKLSIASSAARLRRLLSVGAIALGLTATAHAQGTGFTYQGRLDRGGLPYSGNAEFQPTLWDALASGTQLAANSPAQLVVAVTNGLFVLPLDFGANFPGTDRWLQLEVRTASEPFTALTPRQQITATPYAITAGAVTGLLPVSQVSGTVPLAQLPAAVVTNGASGVNITGTFTGNGAGLTNLPLSALRAVPLTNNQSGVTFRGLTTVSNLLVTATNFVNYLVVTNPPALDGLAITNLNASQLTSGTVPLGQLPGAVVTNNETGVTLTGTFSGNGAGLTNLPLSALRAVPLTNNQSGVTFRGLTTVSNLSVTATNFVNYLVVTNPPVLNGIAITNLNASQLTSGTVPLGQLPGAVVTNNETGVTLTGTFSGNGAALTNIPAAALVAAPPSLVLIPAGAFTMGDTLDGMVNATPISTTVSAFYMDVNLVTWSQWQSVYFWATNHGYGLTRPGSGKAANHPVQIVNWWDCAKWSNARSKQAGRTPVYYTDAGLTKVYTNGEPTTLYPNWAASGYRLPTEAEWEKAARGGLSGQRFPWGNVINQNLANYYGNTASYSYDLGPNGYNPAFTNGVTPFTSPVGSFAANGYGLNDMAGNVFQWCWDWYAALYAGGGDPHGPAGPLSYRVLRGGYWGVNASSSRCANRNGDFPVGANYPFGFRCVRGL
jgi:formylglycine-generating enzyme required for sulfatase activity